MKRHSAMDKHSGLISVHQPNTQITPFLARKPRMFIHWVISFRILLTDVQNNSMFISLFKSFQKSAQPSGTKTRSMKGTVQLSLIREIYTVTIEKLRPRRFSLSTEYSGGFMQRVWQKSRAGARAWEEQSGRLLSPSGGVHAEAVPLFGLSCLSCKMGTALLYEAHRVVVRFLFENKIISYWEQEIQDISFLSLQLLGILKIK